MSHLVKNRKLYKALEGLGLRGTEVWYYSGDMYYEITASEWLAEIMNECGQDYSFSAVVMGTRMDISRLGAENLAVSLASEMMNSFPETHDAVVEFNRTGKMPVKEGSHGYQNNHRHKIRLT